MPQISRETTEQILAATDIVAVIESYIPVKRAGPSYKALCPFHNEKSPSFNINPQRQFFHCFGCGKSGDAITFVREYENLTFSDAVKKLATRAGIAVVEDVLNPEEDKARRQRGKQLDLHREVANFLHRMLLTRAGTHARDYLKSRGFGKEMAVRWMVGWMPEEPRVFFDWAKAKGFTEQELVDSGIFVQKERGGIYLRFRDRLMFPIRNDHGDVIAFSGRQLREDPRSGKYINSPETVLFKKSNVLFALERARKAILKENAVLLCEGQIDAICCHEQGIEHAIAPLGTAFTPSHARILRRYAKTALLCFDSDKAGLAAAERAYRELAAENIAVKVVRMPAGEDPDSFMRKNGPDAFREILAKAVEFFDFMIDRATSENRLADLQQRSVFARECATLLAIVPDAVSREGMINHVATRLRSGVPELRDAVMRAGRAAKNKPAERDRNAPPEPEKVEPAALDSGVAYLCSLALHSGTVQQWLGEQFETLHEASDYIEGLALLESILSARPDPAVPAAINAFLAGLPEEQRLALYSDPTFHSDPPEDAVSAAEVAMARISTLALEKEDGAIKSALADPGLPSERLKELLGRAKEVTHLLGSVRNRAFTIDRFAPSKKPPPRKNPSFSRPENSS